MRYLNRIRPLYFFLAFILGILYVYLLEPSMKFVNKHPTPDNAGKIVYHDKNSETDICYVYDMVKLDCPSDKNTIKQQPIGVSD